MSSPQDPPTSAADLAERALIGALLRDSSRVREVRGWLRPTDLGHWKARAIYQTLVGLQREGRSVPVTELPEVITDGIYHEGPRGAVTAMDLHTYLRATPATPPEGVEFPAHLVRSHHVIYARRVLEAAARQAVALAGSRIQEATEHSREYPELGGRTIQATLAATQQRLADLATRLRHSQGHPGALLTAVLGGPALDPPAVEPALESAELRPGPGAPPLTTRAVIEAERDVLTACLTNPTLRAELLGWLTPGDFSRPEHAATWAAFSALAEAGTPIDYVTLAWECERENPTYLSTGLPAHELATMAQQQSDLPGSAVATVAHASLLRHTDAARQQVDNLLATDRDALTVVSAAEQAYREVGEHARRLTGTTTAVSRAATTLTSPGTPPRTPPPSPTPSPTRSPEEPPQRDHRLGL